MEGENFVSLKGRVLPLNLKTVGANNSNLVSGRVLLPINGKEQHVKISAWGSIAEELSVLPKNNFVHIHGHIEERSYDGNCRHCNGSEKKYWTEVVVDNFVVLE